MPIIFNVYALLQAIIALACLGVLQLLATMFNMDYDLFGGTRESVFSLQFMALIIAFTDARGLKGRFFYLPTWLVLILGSIFIFHLVVSYGLDQPFKMSIFLYCSSVLIGFFYFRQSKKFLVKLWAKKKGALELLKSRIQQGQPDESEYWKMAPLVYYRPPAIYFTGHSIWKFLFANAIDGDDFLEHYKYFINSIRTENLITDEQRSVISEIKEAINPAQNFNSYHHPEFSLWKLGNIIDGMNEKLKL